MTPSLVLLHGFTGSEQSFQSVLAGLGGQAALVPALLGHGAQNADHVEGFEAEVDRLGVVLRAAGVRRARLVGYSLGGRLALGLMLRHAELFSDAILVGAQPGLSTEIERAERRRADENWCALLERAGIEAFVDAWQAQPLFASQQRLPRALLERQRRERLTHSPAGLVCSLRSTGLGAMPCYAQALADVRMPVRLVAGGLDEKFCAIARAMAERLPRARIDVIEGAGHNVVLERPDALSAMLSEEAPA